ncbi:hypothetical protein GCM10020331_035060 [Ectobacillus funiculus]
MERVLEKNLRTLWRVFFESIEDIKHTYEENQLLKEKLDKYAKLSVDVKNLQQDNEELRAIFREKKMLLMIITHCKPQSLDGTLINGMI